MKRAILQNELRNLVVMAASVFALAACGGGGGGGGDHGGGLAAGTFTRTFNAGAANAVNGPFFNAALGDITIQFLHTAAQVGGSGRITKLKFPNASGTGSPTTCPNTTIRLGHSSITTDLAATFATNFNLGTPLVALNNATVTIPAGAAGSFFEVALTTPFEYNGVDSLVVQIDRTTTCSGPVPGTEGASANTRTIVSYAADATPGTADNDTTTGGLYALSGWLEFVFSGGDNRIGLGGAGSLALPFNTTGTRFQYLYLPSEINGSGPITGVAFPISSTSVAGTYTLTVRLGHSTLAALTTTYASNYSGSPTTVANGVANFAVPANVPVGEWVWMPIPDGVFTYNGTDNLIVDVSTSAGTANNFARTASIANRRAIGLDPAGATAIAVDGNIGEVALRFHGGRVVKLSAGTGNNDAIFNGMFSTATLYSAAALGTAGSITSVSCRLQGPSAAADYANFKVVIGHATGSTLSGTAATDFVSQSTVFSGTFAVPAGLLAGDWIDIPLSSPFAYNGKDNLIVWMGNGGPGPGTGTINVCRGENNATRYPAGLGVSATGVGSATYSPVGWTTDIRMTVQK